MSFRLPGEMVHMCFHDALFPRISQKRAWQVQRAHSFRTPSCTALQARYTMALRLCTQQLCIATCARSQAFTSAVPRHNLTAASHKLYSTPLVQRPASKQSRGRSTLAGGVVMAGAAQTLHDFQTKVRNLEQPHEAPSCIVFAMSSHPYVVSARPSRSEPASVAAVKHVRMLQRDPRKSTHACLLAKLFHSCTPRILTARQSTYQNTRAKSC